MAQHSEPMAQKEAGPPQRVGLKLSALKSAHITKVNDTQENRGIFADHNEVEGAEYQHAVNSLAKNGHCLDSKVRIP